MTTETTSDYAALLSGMSNLHIECRRWFHRGPGNTYHSVRIFRNGKVAEFVPFAYGYGEQCLQTAWELLQRMDVIPAAEEYGGTLALREKYGIGYSVADVSIKRDL